MGSHCRRHRRPYCCLPRLLRLSRSRSHRGSDHPYRPYRRQKQSRRKPRKGRALPRSHPTPNNPARDGPCLVHIQRPTTNIQRPTPNVQHPTPNIQRWCPFSSPLACGAAGTPSPASRIPCSISAKQSGRAATSRSAEGEWVRNNQRPTPNENADSERVCLLSCFPDFKLKNPSAKPESVHPTQPRNSF
jgi:hypothetical protein